MNDQMTLGCFYADLDVETAVWCVFHTENSHAYASYASEEEAEVEAERLNQEADRLSLVS